MLKIIIWKCFGLNELNSNHNFKIIHVTAIHYGTPPKKINVIIETFLMIDRVSAMPRTNNTYNSK